MANERRDVRVVLDVTLGPDGTAAIRRVEDATRSAADAQRAASLGVQGGGPPGRFPGGVPGGGGGGGGPGGGGLPGMGGFGRMFAALATVQTLTNAATSAAQIQANPFMTEDLAMRKMYRDVVPFGFGKQSQEWVDALSGRSRGMAEQGLAGRFGQVAVTGENRTREFQTDFNITQAGREERARQAARATPVFLNPIDRRSAEGERRFQEESQLLGPRREAAKLAREQLAVTEERKAAEEEMAKLGNAQELSIRTINQLRDQQHSKTGEDELARLNAVAKEESKLTSITEQRIQLASRIVDMKKQEAVATAAVKAQEAQTLEVRARIAETRAATASSAAQTLGEMNPFERQQAVQAFKMLKQYGPQGVAPEQLALAKTFAPEDTAKILEQYGARTPEYQEGKKLSPVRYADDPEKLRQDAESLRRQAEVSRVQGEANIARASADAGRDLGSFVAQQVLQVVESAKNQIRIEFKTAAQAGG